MKLLTGGTTAQKPTKIRNKHMVYYSAVGKRGSPSLENRRWFQSSCFIFVF